ncbi:MAG TPA: Uma2 family endonuclease [Bryobacteraceae bacterium]|nr:Uma2 family endonuclease [Bryobacteraceae bacterium]
MATTTDLLTWEEFERLPGEGKFELIAGRLLNVPPPKKGHSKVAKRLLRALFAVEARVPVEAYAEAGYKLSDDPASWLQPDVSVVRRDRDRQTHEDGYFIGAPELAVEVVSPSETAQDLARKIKLFLGFGAIAVWVIYPDSREVQIHVPGGTAFTRGVGANLTIPELLPDWEFPVAKLFED